MWKSSSFTVHNALKTLIKEGWIESIRGAGTYVAQPKTRFTCAGIYHSRNICSEDETPFARRLHVALLERFRELGKETLIFMDTRPDREQGTLLPSLAEAVLHRRIQCLVFPIANQVNLPALSRLRMPTATLSAPSPSIINFDSNDFFHGSVRNLAEAGCRSVALLSSYRADLIGSRRDPFYKYFRNAVREAGLLTRREWIMAPGDFVPVSQLESFGFEQFRRLWQSKQKPDGLIVYPDTVARGVVMAILEQGGTTVTKEMKFVFHRNAHQGFLCPFPVRWAISDEDLLGAELISQIQRQFAGEKPSSRLLPYVFQSDFTPKSEEMAAT